MHPPSALAPVGTYTDRTSPDHRPPGGTAHDPDELARRRAVEPAARKAIHQATDA
ncbi:hypothetical protein ACFV2X_07525 [Streptomyces sp. NPDC059679]|uniref:hypothetical protein n=1 Tax=Streptomyces sp. NPDC059679 TaxID=3346903 RepID=UPI0036945C0C